MSELLKEELLNAIIDYDLKKIKQLIQEGVKVNEAFKYNVTDRDETQTIEHKAIIVIFIKIASKYFLDKEFNEKECLEIIELLVKAGADINAKDQEGRTAIKQALQSSYPPLIQLLINLGVDVSNQRELVENIGISSNNQLEVAKIRNLDDAIQSKDLDKVKEALSLGINHKEYIRGYICNAIKTKNVQLLRLMIEYGFNVNKYGHENQSPLITAALNKDEVMVSILITAGANPLESCLLLDKRLHRATKEDKPDLIEAQDFLRDHLESNDLEQRRKKVLSDIIKSELDFSSVITYLQKTIEERKKSRIEIMLNTGLKEDVATIKLQESVDFLISAKQIKDQEENHVK